MRQRLRVGALGTALVVIATFSVLLPGHRWLDEAIVSHRFTNNRTTLEVWTERGYYSPSCWETQLHVDRSASIIDLTFESRKTNDACTMEGCGHGLTADAVSCASERIDFDGPVPEFVDITYSREP